MWDRLEIMGPAVPVVEGVMQLPGRSLAYAVSATGTLVYLSGATTAPERRLVWVARNGTEQALAAPRRPYGYPRIAPDGRIAVELEDQI